MQIIDPHLHLFNRALGQYSWLNANNPPFWPDKAVINKDFSLQDIKLEAPLALEGFVHIEAGFDNIKPWREIQWLETFTLQDTPPAMRSVASIDLLTPSNEFDTLLQRFISFKSVIGVRHILDEQALELLQSTLVIANLEIISAKGLIFECQLSGCDSAAIEQLAKAIALIPALKIIINHAGFASPQPNEYAKWLQNMATLAKFEQLYIKASGWEMCERQYTLDHVQTVTDNLINIYGIERVMFASNFPLCLFTKSYQQLWQSYTELALSSSQLDKLMADNARLFYQF